MPAWENFLAEEGDRLRIECLNLCVRHCIIMILRLRIQMIGVSKQKGGVSRLHDMR